MRFTPEKYSIPDERMKPFIDPEEIVYYLENPHSSKERSAK